MKKLALVVCVVTFSQHAFSAEARLYKDEYLKYDSVGFFDSGSSDIREAQLKSSIFYVHELQGLCRNYNKMMKAVLSLKDFYNYFAEQAKYGDNNSSVKTVHQIYFASNICKGGREYIDYAAAARKGIESAGIVYTPMNIVGKKKNSNYELLSDSQ